MADSHLTPPPYAWLLLGIFTVVMAVVATCTGEAWSRGCVVYRAKKPVEFWFVVAIYYVGGVFLIGYFLFEVYGFPN
jgi:hypothetical protein